MLVRGDSLISSSVTAASSPSPQDAPLVLSDRPLLRGVLHGDEPELQAAGGERGAVLALRVPGAQQADEAPQHQVPDPQHPAAGAGAQHQPGHDPPAAAQSAASDAAAGPVRPAGGGGGPRHDGDHHHYGHHAQPHLPGRVVLLLPLQPQSEDPAQEHPDGSAVGSPAPGPHGHHRLPAALTPETWEGGEQHPRASALAEDRHRRRSRFLAERRHQVPASGLAAPARGQLRRRDQRLQLQGRRSGCDVSRARRGRTATFHRGEDPRQPQEVPPRLGPQLRRGVVGDALLPLPAHRGLRGVRLGLDHRAQTLPGQLLLGRVRVHAPAAVPPRTPGEQGQPQGQRGALLHPHQDVAHQHALLQPQGADHLREDPVHGGGPLRLLLTSSWKHNSYQFQVISCGIRLC